ncbi:MAG: hypothetical protein ACJZ83_13770 [Pseudohongiellaceae bacterium]
MTKISQRAMRIRLPALLFTLLAAGWAWAAENQVEQSEENSEATEEAVLAETVDDAAPPISDEPAIGEPGEALEDEESPGRFVPTEQISQDLGVSFPVDI